MADCPVYEGIRVRSLFRLRRGIAYTFRRSAFSASAFSLSGAGYRPTEYLTPRKYVLATTRNVACRTPEPDMKKAKRTPHFRGAPVDLVVDVRSRLEFWTGHLPGAICIPVDNLPAGLDGRGVTPESRILVYCGSGQRSANAAAQLRAAGFEHVVDGGGMTDAWNNYVP
jgi:phage shock protein E